MLTSMVIMLVMMLVAVVVRAPQRVRHVGPCRMGLFTISCAVGVAVHVSKWVWAHVFGRQWPDLSQDVPQLYGTCGAERLDVSGSSACELAANGCKLL